jgi:hypothetical protein
MYIVAANFFLDVTTTSADALGNADAVLSQKGAGLLQTGSGCGDNAHRTGRDDVGECQSHTIEDGCTGARTHYQQTMVAAVLFES